MNMRFTTVLLAIILVFSLGTVHAQGIYIGASIGNTFFGSEFNLENEVKDINENSTGYKFFGGFSSDSFFQLEGGYRNLGTVKTDIEGFSIESKTSGWDVYGMGRLQVLNLIDLFAKAGAFFWKTESGIVQQALGEDSGTAFAWGLGAGVHLGPIGVRLEWENFQVDDPATLSMLSLGATFGF
jgi:OOP family OmpA-OmpF porin